MYLSYFGFSEAPFQITPNPKFLYLSKGHREALATLRYGLRSAPGITLLLGEAGTGKTVLLRTALAAEQAPGRRHALINNPAMSPTDFLETLAATFGMSCSAGSKGRFLMAFERDLVERFKIGGRTAVVVDEAQSLSHEMLEEIRLLANLETDTAKLVNLVLVGQPELADRLNNPSLRQFKQRIMLRCSLDPLDLTSTAAYIAQRIRIAGGSPRDIFTRDAVEAIYEASHGIPRTIGVICENALLTAFASDIKLVDRPIIEDVCRDFDLSLSERGRRPSVVSPPATAQQTDRGAHEAAPDTHAAQAADQAPTATSTSADGSAPNSPVAPADGDADTSDAPPKRRRFRVWFTPRRTFGTL